MAQLETLFGSGRVVGVKTGSPVDKRRWWPAALLDALVARFGKLPTDEEIEAAWELMEEEDRLQEAAIRAQKEAYFNSFFAGSVD